MEPSVEPQEGLWVVRMGGVPIFSGGYRSVEDYLDWAENGGSIAESDAPDGCIRRAHARGMARASDGPPVPLTSTPA